MSEKENYLILENGLKEILSYTRSEYIDHFSSYLDVLKKNSIRYKIALKVINMNYDLALECKVLSDIKPNQLKTYLNSGLVSYIDKKGSYYCYKLNK